MICNAVCNIGNIVQLQVVSQARSSFLTLITKLNAPAAKAEGSSSGIGEIGRNSWRNSPTGIGSVNDIMGNSDEGMVLQ
jgi:hypothetical protein